MNRMTYEELIDSLTIEADTKIVMLVLDGVGGLRMEGRIGTELQVAKKPNLDELAKKSICGLLDPVAPGISPGSGPGHFALFGYDPLNANIGRGVLSAAGLGFDLTERDVAARANFCTIDQAGKVIDRRAGRIDTETNKRLCEKLRKGINLGPGVEVFIETEKEHRALVVFRGDGLSGDVSDTDPQIVGEPPLEPKALTSEAEKTAQAAKKFSEQAKAILANEPRANMILLRGFAKHRPYKSMMERYKLRALCIANYPMYRGVAKLIGMDIHPITPDIPSEFEALRENFSRYDFFFVHVKTTDARGEDGDFEAKVKAIEDIDALIPRITALNPEVFIVTGDHSTPAALKSHSWHPVPVLLYSNTCRADEVDRFDEVACLHGGLGHMSAMQLMGVALAHAMRLKRFGA